MTIAHVILDAIHPSGGAGLVRLADGTEQGGVVPVRGLRHFDTVLFEPDAEVLGDAAALAKSCEGAVQCLAAGGVVHAIVAPGKRNAVARLFRSHGLIVGAYYALVMSGQAQIALPLTGPAIRLMRDGWAVSPRWSMVERLARLPGAAHALLARALPRIVMTVHHPGTRLAAWLADAAGDACHPMVVTNWRGQGSSGVAFAFGGSSPFLVAKRCSPESRPSVLAEQEALSRVGTMRQLQGIRVPRPLGFAAAGMWTLQGFVKGRPLGLMVQRGATEAEPACDALAEAVWAWNLETRVVRPADMEMLEAFLLGPLDELSRHVAVERYRKHLVDAFRRVAGRAVSLVATHNDLTGANVLWAPRGGAAPLGLVDWEAFVPEGLPLTDLLYSICDLALAAHQGGGRFAAFRHCFVEETSWRNALDSKVAAWRRETGDSLEWLSLCFHACWLGHARNEQRQEPAAEAPFLSIVREISRWESLSPPGWC